MRFLTNWRIHLDKVPAYVDFNQEFHEQIDYQLATMILDYNGDDRLSQDVKDEFRKVVDKIDRKTNMLPVKYSPRYKIGRRYADCPERLFPNQQPNPAYDKYYSALISQPRLIKNTIFKYQGWVDIDQRKGHPTLLLAVAEANEVYLPAYKKYLLEGNFDKIVADMSAYYSIEGENPIDKKDIKWLFNKTIYGGGHKKWVEDIVEGCRSKDGKKICKRTPKEMKNRDNPHPFYQEFYKDTQKIIDLVYLNNDEIKNIVCKDIKETDAMILAGKDFEWKRKNRVLSYFCGVLENEITYKAYKYLVDNHIIQKGFCDWGFDGITFPHPAPYTDFDFHLKEMNEYVRKQTGMPSITFVRKEFDDEEVIMPLIEERRNIAVAVPLTDVPMVDGVAITEQEVLNDDSMSQASSTHLNGVIDDDNEGAEMIYNAIKERFKLCGGNIFFKQTNIWVNSKQKIDNHLLHYILTKTNLMKMSAGKCPSPKPYSTNVGGAKALREAVYAKLYVEGEDNTLLQKFITTTRGKLCFLDGVLDFTYVNPETQAKGKFYTWADVNFPYYTPVQIERNFADYFATFDPAVIKEIKDKIFVNLFGEHDCKKALAFFARGVAGHFEDKTWALYIGNRNCGKGVVDCLAKSALGQYHGSVEAQNLLCNSSRILKQEQPEKQMAFAMDFQFCRLVFSQELPPPPKNKSIKINADIIKKLNSGGDMLKGKRNYDVNITEFINQARMVVMANDCPTLTNDDALQTCCEFNSTISFKTQEEIDVMKANGKADIILQQFKVADPLIKDKCRTDEWCNAFIMLMVQSYEPHAVVCIDKVEVDDDDDDNNENKMDLREFIITAFEITNKKTDFLKNATIQDVFETQEYGDISAKKIAIELKAIGLKSAKKTDRGWLGIKTRSPPTPAVSA
jgi:hypothetical protein